MTDRPIVALRTSRLRAFALRTTWHAWRHHVDLCRTSTAICPA